MELVSNIGKVSVRVFVLLASMLLTYHLGAQEIKAGVYRGYSGHTGGTITAFTPNYATAYDTLSPNSSELTSISAGYYSTCAVRSDGTAKCWGDDSYGNTTPPAGVAFTAVSITYVHGCGLKADGTVQCWGRNHFKQAAPPAGVIFKSLSAGSDHTCGVRSDNAIQCWGADDYGQVTPPTGGTYLSVTAGGHHTCGLKTDGTVQCWGADHNGQAYPPAGVEFTAISAGLHHTCGIKPDSTVQCWGYNHDGQLDAPLGVKFTQLSAGTSHTCGVRLDGHAQCWGYNGFQQAAPPSDVLFSAVSSGFYHSCGVRTDGAFTCWGYNSYGEAPRLAISPDSLPVAEEDAPFSQGITAGGGTGPYVYSVAAGSLPPGLTLSSNGLLSGTPSSGSAGTYQLNVRAIDANYIASNKLYTLTVNEGDGQNGTPTACPLQFTDVSPDTPFFAYVNCLACRSVLTGYSDNSHCAQSGVPCFRPNDPITRGQAAKILANAAGYNEPVPTERQTFKDVPGNSPFWLYIERIYLHSAIGGYECGGFNDPVEPCPGTYFRPGANLTRGQLAKIASSLAGYSETPTGQTFRDVSSDSPFYLFVERAAAHGIISGYPCGSPGEPCPGAYFRPGVNVTRGQAAKIISGTFFPNCVTPARR